MTIVKGNSIMGTLERRKREKKQRTEDILRAAEKLFAANGFSATTMDQIANEAELSKGSLYTYFKSKDDVHRQFVSIGMQILYDMILEKIATADNGWSKLAVFWDCFMSFQTEYPDHCDAFIHYESKDSEFDSQEQIEEWIDRRKAVRLMIAIINEGIADGSLRVDLDPLQTTLMLWAQICGAIQLIRFKRTLIEKLLSTGTDGFLINFKAHVFENLRRK
jgi:TetR/AcrR family transcriptional regulator